MVELNRDIHVWEVNLDRQMSSPQQLDKLSGYLNEQERQRAAKFVNPLHGDRWTVARGYLRSILSDYLDIPPARINFNYGVQGKPELEGNPLRFNLSHSRDRAVYAISAKHSVGIDIEYIHHVAAGDLVDRFFSPAEIARFHSLPASIQQAAFFHAWTQKEAYLKAEGTGLSTPLARIEVSIDPRTPAQIVAAPTPAFWQIYKLELSSEYAGAIVIGGEFEAIEFKCV
jgi:4'-phosphopantetheinyl transferase